MNILIITGYYKPEVRSCSQVLEDLAKGLKERDHNVIVTTSYPRTNIPEGFPTPVSGLSTEDQVQVLRVKTLPHNRLHFIFRGISELLLPYLYVISIFRYIKKVDAVIVYSPPLSLTLAGNFIKKIYRAKFILNIQDIFPQNAIDLGILKNKLLIQLYEKIERKAYQHADQIIVHSEGNKNFLILEKKLNSEKLEVVYNWINMEPYKQAQRTSVFRKKYGLENKFIFLFAGVIGPSQGLDLLVRLAHKVKNIPEICFLIVGDGREKERLVEISKQQDLDNIHFQPFVAPHEYPLLAKDADIGVVCLTEKNKTPVVPGKILGYMSASIPIAAFLQKESDAHELIREARCGYSCISDNENGALEIILQLYKEKGRLKEYGEKGFLYACENFDTSVCMDKFEKIIKKHVYGLS